MNDRNEKDKNNVDGSSLNMGVANQLWRLPKTVPIESSPLSSGWQKDLDTPTVHSHPGLSTSSMTNTASVLSGGRNDLDKAQSLGLSFMNGSGVDAAAAAARGGIGYPSPMTFGGAHMANANPVVMVPFQINYMPVLCAPQPFACVPVIQQQTQQQLSLFVDSSSVPVTPFLFEPSRAMEVDSESPTSVHHSSTTELSLNSGRSSKRHSTHSSSATSSLDDYQQEQERVFHQTRQDLWGSVHSRRGSNSETMSVDNNLVNVVVPHIASLYMTPAMHLPIQSQILPLPQHIIPPEQFSTLPRGSHSITAHTMPPRPPSTPEEYELPLDVESVSCLSVTRTCRYMSRHVRRRMDSLWELLASLRPFAPTSYPPLDARWANTLLDTETAEPAANCSPFGLCYAFTVVEDSVSTSCARAARLRFMCLPSELNLLIEQQGHVPHLHLTQDLCAGAAAPYGATCRLKAGAYQVPLPHSLRWLFRFAVSDGRLLQLTKLPMGLSIGPEILSLLVGALGGHRDICSHQWVVPDVKLNISVDKVQWLGDESCVRQAEWKFVKRCEECGVVLDREATYIGKRYSFARLAFNHGHHTVCMAGPAAALLREVHRGKQLTYGDVEGAVNAIWLPSRVLNIAVQRYWYALECARRCVVLLNAGIVTESDTVVLPTLAYSMLKEWVAIVIRNEPRVVCKDTTTAAIMSTVKPPVFHILTTLSDTEWSGICIEDTTKHATVANGCAASFPSLPDAAVVTAVANVYQEFHTILPQSSVIYLRVYSAAHASHRCAQSFPTGMLYAAVPQLRNYNFAVDYLSSQWD